MHLFVTDNNDILTALAIVIKHSVEAPSYLMHDYMASKACHNICHVKYV